MAKATEKTLTITQVKSGIGFPKDQKATVRALGLKRLNQTVVLPDNPAVRGMVFKVKHLVKVEEA
ncbi:MAG: 50S ribosomal protein L30 [Coriobacteriia bacterium]|nr:50S ribosomal protein L30 [Coriobacteriia bacterium]MBN2823291.1 50S ribosomal protein L30 [Coriobacteriia bacterium]